MPVVKLHISAELSPDACGRLTVEARKALVVSLGIPEQMGKVILYSAPIHCRSVHETRDPGFVLAEVLMFTGRPQEVKNRLFKALNQVITSNTGVSEDNIFINIIETPRGDWGIRGGRPACDVELGY